MPILSPIRLTHAHSLMEGQLADHSVTVVEGLIAQGPAPEVNLQGYYLLPGIVDLHGDGFERHLSPRPSAPFEPKKALASAAAELAVNGVTTAWFAQSWSWEGGFRSGPACEALLAALQEVRADVLPDVRVQIRLETHVIDQHDAVRAAVARFGVDYVVFNNHLPEALEMAQNRPERFAQWAAQTSRSHAEMLAIVNAASAQDRDVPEALARIAAAFTGQGLRMGSHDDGDAQTRAFYRGIGAAICEFPTSFAAAKAAQAAGEPVLMGAPNVVRGGSQSGNIAAQDLVEAGLCDALVSDYYYPALAQAAWALVDRGVCDLPTAWAKISTTPARIAGLSDRGGLGTGQRADLVAVNMETHRVEMTLCAGRVAHLSGALAAKVWARLG
ncbi:MAG: alpha-D-ribose 1-methylphosphonate 5-triphosphate diphosphatase [Microgenomates group bacterium]